MKKKLHCCLNASQSYLYFYTNPIITAPVMMNTKIYKSPLNNNIFIYKYLKNITSLNAVCADNY